MLHEHPLRSLKAELLLEASARQAAHKRVLVLKTYSQLAISLTSFFIVCTSILALVFADRLTTLGITVLGCATIFAAIYSMIVDNVENSKNYSEKAFRMEKSAIAMRKLYDRLNHFSDDDAKAPVKQTQQDKNEIISAFGDIYSITDQNYAKWLNREHLQSVGIECSGLDDAEAKYLRSRYQVFWAYLIFPTILILASFVYVAGFAIEAPR